MLLEKTFVDAITYRPGAVILYPGKSDMLYRVQSGLVRVHTMDDEGNGLTLRYVKPGEFFGEEALAGVERHYFAEAVTDSTVDVINPALMNAEDNLEVTTHLVKTLDRAYDNIYRLVGKRLRARIAGELLELKDTALATQLQTGETMIYATHDELAAAVGSVRETVTKVVGELSREGVISAGYGKITLKNERALADIAAE
ncbi:helix-turn-helix domain-containing protein [Deinococcus maricopensis]|uniref:Transcriptional regulator, Crp/Fnr family n=1 Tax=Deinococcus maricopensis (strain DSM 21211 / LMG 22137 / NRRL B-23946 / LB-34) TaxID=709986 RepID=E8UAE9_DEIML|nr:helix-turn-helix domain-containing protein [Deinococcus maricopensis]ADV68038.1 transcriptional regulator, Crp/Fnr family [Deinococcus maricopensis DSM 21211]